MHLDDWFLAAGERGNPHTALDDRHGGVPWTDGNHAQVLIDGKEYFSHLYPCLQSTGPGDSVYLTGLEGDADEQLAGEGTEIADVLGRLARNGVRVCGLVWRSHGVINAEGKNLAFSRAVNESGGEVALDNRIRRGGSHHQKIVVLRHRSRPVDDVAFVGGMDLVHGRHDDGRHLGDPQHAELNADDYGEQPGWHDVQVALRGPAVDDVAYTFRERWEDPTPRDTRNPLRWALHRVSRQPREPDALVRERVDPAAVGPHSVQVLRTYPSRRRRYPFAPQGERSIARAYIKAFERARSLIYFEDQYLWSFHATRLLGDALRREPELRLVVVIPRFPDPNGRITGAASKLGREKVQQALYDAGGERVAIYDLERDDGTPVYVHSKACIVDDIWLAVGSDNLNRRSWTHDSEISCAIIDETHDDREPRDPSGRGDGARKLARDTRLRLAQEHTGGSAAVSAMIDPVEWFDELRRCAETLDAWHRNGKRGDRPPGHLRPHVMEHVHVAEHGLVHWAHTHLLDPDGRPRTLRRHDTF